MVVVCNNKTCPFEVDGFCGKEMVAIQCNGGCSEFFNKHGQIIWNKDLFIDSDIIQAAKDRIKTINADEVDLRVIDQECPHDLKNSLKEKEEGIKGEDTEETK